MKHLLLLMPFMFLSAKVLAGAWVQEKGRGLTINTVRLQADQERSRFEFNPYAEHGLSSRLTMAVNVGSSSEDQSRSKRNLQTYGEFSLRTPVREFSKSIMSAQVMAGSVMENSEDGQRRVYPLSDLRVMYGENFQFSGLEGLYLNSELGIRTFYGERGNEWRLEQTIGWKHNPSVLLGQLIGVKNWKRELSAKEYDLLELQVSYVLPIFDLWSIQAGLSSALAGQNIASSPTLFMGVWYRW